MAEIPLNCLLHAFQTVTGLNLIERLGHDGSEIIYPDLPEPICRRGFHTQELFKACWPDFACMALWAWPKMSPIPERQEYTKYLNNTEWFTKMIHESNGVVVGMCGEVAHCEPCIDGQYEMCFDSIYSFIVILGVKHG